jgi:DNA-binding response OmpR family regulator
MNAPSHILVAEDDVFIREGLEDLLSAEGYRVTAASDGAAALRRYREEAPDLVLLDLMMPKLNGYEVCREIRKENNRVGILMLTAKGEEIDKVSGLQLGADDYVTKPFGVRELLARVEACLRRTLADAGGIHGSHRPRRFRIGSAEIDPKTFEATLNGRQYPLSERELRLLEVFHANPGAVLSRDYLLRRVWGLTATGATRTLDQHIAQLRKKVEPDPQRPESILTVHGVGYRYGAE